MITIENDGRLIRSTNYWDSEHARLGYFFLSWNAGAARLLVPDSQTSQIKEMRTGDVVIISREPLEGRPATLIIFDDHTQEPYSVHVLDEQSDRVPSREPGGFLFFAWTREGEQLCLPARFE